MNKINIPELLSPVGDMEKLMAAINARCNAVYLGGKSFSARSQAGNFELDEIAEALDIAHLRDVKIYITVNTVYKDVELEEVFEFISKAYVLGVDAFIVQDIGTAMFIKENFPDAKLHASTQMTISNLEGALYLQNLGFDRIVLSRELSLDEIKNITDNTTVETEVFVHGALCVSFSGQCTISSLIGGRSGNRGQCAQTCRLKFDLMEDGHSIEDGYLLSPKDVMTLPILKDIIESGVTSLKIEGRMKKKEYVATVTDTYRKQLDKISEKNYSVDRQDVNNLAQVFVRGDSFSSGYFKTYSNENMMSTKTPKKTGLYLGKVQTYRNGKVSFKSIEPLTAGDRIGIFTQTLPHVGSSINTDISKGGEVRLDIKGNIQVGDPVYKSYSKDLVDNVKQILNDDNRKIVIEAGVNASVGDPLEFWVRYNDIEVFAHGDLVEKSENRPITEEKLLEQLGKTGSTTFLLNYTEVNVEEDIFLRISSINQLRREVIEDFSEKFLKSFKRNKVDYIVEKNEYTNENLDDKKILVLVRNKKAFNAAIAEEIDGIYIDHNILKQDVDYYIDNSNGVKIYSDLPTVTRMYDVKKLFEELTILEEKNIAGFLIKNYTQIELLKNSKKEKIINSNFNVMNDLSYNFFKDKADRITSSTEMNLKEINQSNGKNREIVGYGRLNVMTIAQCPVGLYVGRKHSERFCEKRYTEQNYSLIDQKEFEFPVKTNCHQCYASLYNSSVLYMSDKMFDLRESNSEFIRLEFLDEDEETIKNVIKVYNFIKNNKQHEFKIQDKNITYGHFYRGVL